MHQWVPGLSKHSLILCHGTLSVAALTSAVLQGMLRAQPVTQGRGAGVFFFPVVGAARAGH